MNTQMPKRSRGRPKKNFDPIETAFIQHKLSFQYFLKTIEYKCNEQDGPLAIKSRRNSTSELPIKLLCDDFETQNQHIRESIKRYEDLKPKKNLLCRSPLLSSSDDDQNDLEEEEENENINNFLCNQKKKNNKR